MLIFSTTENIFYFLEIFHHFTSSVTLGALLLLWASFPTTTPHTVSVLSFQLFSQGFSGTILIYCFFHFLIQSMWSLYNTSHLHWILRNSSLWLAILFLWPPYATRAVAETPINVCVNCTVQEKYRTLKYKTVKNVIMVSFEGVVHLGEFKGLSGFAKVSEFYPQYCQKRNSFYKGRERLVLQWNNEEKAMCPSLLPLLAVTFASSAFCYSKCWRKV